MTNSVLPPVQPFVRQTMTDALPPPASQAGILGWMRSNLFPTPVNSIASLLLLAVVSYVGYKMLNFLVLTAVWQGTNADVCIAAKVGHPVGACWPFIAAKMRLFMYGFYPQEQIWRVNVTYVLALVLLVPLLIPKAPYKLANAVLFFGVLPLVAMNLLVGGALLAPWLAVLKWIGIALAVVFALGFAMSVMEGAAQLRRLLLAGLGVALALTATALNASVGDALTLPLVETRQWGGLLVTLVVSITGIVISLPLGIALALGRRSSLPVLRFLSVALIELVRGVPLITVLFFATYMLPLFLTHNPDGLVRVLVGISLFAGAYMAEVVRGGLQAMPKGQFEGAMALGLGQAQMMGLIILPQALKMVIPGIVNLFIALLKDTTLVSIVSIFDLLGQLRAGTSDANWASPVTLFTGFAFAGFIYFGLCFAISRYSLFVERRLNTSHR